MKKNESPMRGAGGAGFAGDAAPARAVSEAVFRFYPWGRSRGVDFSRSEMQRANRDDAEFCRWCAGAELGERWRDGGHFVVRVR